MTLRKICSYALGFGFLLSVPAAAQTNPIPNAGFENWTAGSPDNWFANNVPTVYTTCTQSANAHSGSSALQGTIVSYMGVPVAPLVYAQFSIASRYAAFTGWYQFSQAATDSFVVAVVVYKSQTAIGAGAFSTSAASASYGQFSVPIDYISPDVPDSAYIEIGASVESMTTGSSFLVDDLSFSGTATGVDAAAASVPADLTLEGNFPNPFNPSTQIRYTLGSQANVQIIIYDVLGRVVDRLVNAEQAPGQHQVSWNPLLPSGNYFYEVRATNNAGKMSLERGRMLLLR